MFGMHQGILTALKNRIKIGEKEMTDFLEAV